MLTTLHGLGHEAVDTAPGVVATELENFLLDHDDVEVPQEHPGHPRSEAEHG